MAALMVQTVSCKKEKKSVNPLPTTIWTATWNFMGSAPFKATLVFEEKMVRLVIASMDFRENEIPCLLYGRNEYLFVNDSEGGGQVSFTLSFLSSIAFSLSNMKFSGSFHPDSEVLTLQVSNDEGLELFGADKLEFIKEPTMTTQTHPLPGTVWTASWVNEGDVLVKNEAWMAFESSSVDIIIAPDMKVNGIPIVYYGNTHYDFQYQAADRKGDISFTLAPQSSMITIPEIVFSGTFNLDSDVLTLHTSSEYISLSKDGDINFVRN